MDDSSKSAQEILAVRLAELGLSADIQADKASSHLSPIRHPIGDFFVIDLFDAPLKDDLASMEHPLFALKSGDVKDRHYEHNGMTVDITPTSAGMATVHDKDLWIYCTSALVAAKNRGEEISPVVRFKAYDFLVSTNRHLGGDGYRRLMEALDRLAGTRIITNISTGGKVKKTNFGLLDAVKIIHSNNLDDESPMAEIEVHLPVWLFRSIEAAQIRTISPDYFRIRKPLDRRIYELCAKHCGEQGDWKVSLGLLHKKSGSSATLREFRRAVKSLVDSNQLPDYRLSYDAERDLLRVRQRKGSLKRVKQEQEI